MKLLHQLEVWYDNLPEQLFVNESNAYIHRELNIGEAVYCLHFLYNSVVCDLTRVCLPGYGFPLAAAFHDAPAPFRRQCQDRCRFHADEIIRLVRDVCSQPKELLDDHHCMMATYEATKIQIIHTTTVTTNSFEERQKAVENIRVAMKFLEMNQWKKHEENKIVSDPNQRPANLVCLTLGMASIER